MKAVGFDFGHTLAYNAVPLSWSEHYQSALRYAARQTALVLSDANVADACSVLEQYNTRVNPRITEVTSEEVFGHVFREIGLPDDQSHPFSSAFFSYFERTLQLFDDALPALHSFRSLGLRLGVLTDVPYGKPHDLVQREISQLGETLGLLDCLLTSTDVGFRKPSPVGLHDLAQSLGCRPADMAYVGDEPKDVAASKAAGVTAILLVRKGEIPQFGQDITVSSLTEFHQVLQR